MLMHGKTCLITIGKSQGTLRWICITVCNSYYSFVNMQANAPCRTICWARGRPGRLRSLCVTPAATQTCAKPLHVATKVPNWPRAEKPCLWGVRPCPTQTGLYNLRRCLEACNIGNKVVEGLCGKKGADHRRGNRAADLCICIRRWKKQVLT